ncbi:MAG TPA: outer membrane exchange protein TraA family protein, partial [Myxococcaceae bacterium]|nr:outer membrane exchange protein TraA family protein [Myxococcaceae bacterium]
MRSPPAAWRLFAVALVVIAGAAAAQPTPTLVTGGPAAAALPSGGPGLCGTSALSTSPASDFPQQTTTFNSGVNAFLDARTGSRVTSVLRTAFDLSNNNQTGMGLSQGDFVDAQLPACPSWGCPFAFNDTTTSFGSRFRGYLNVPQDL